MKPLICLALGFSWIGYTVYAQQIFTVQQYPSDNCVKGTCPSNFLYYFACCADECCLRLQPIPALVLGAFACVVGLSIVYAICCFCCGRKP